MALVFVATALVAALFGFGVLSSYSGEEAKILFVVFLVLAVLSFVGHGFRRRSV